MAETLALRLGPLLDRDPCPYAYLLAGSAGDVVKVITADNDVEGVKSLMETGERFGCETVLEGAARVLGLGISAPSQAHLSARACAAIILARRPDLPADAPPLHRRMILQGLGALAGTHAWQRLEDDIAAVRVKGSFEDRRYDMDQSIALDTEGPDPVIHLALVDHIGKSTPEAILARAEEIGKIEIRLLSEPAYAIDALSEAFGLGYFPQILAEGRFVDAGWISRFGPVLGTALYGLALLTPRQERISTLISDEPLFEFQVDAGFGLPKTASPH